VLCPEALHQDFISGSVQGLELLICKTSPTDNFFMACHMRITGIPIEQSPSCILSLISIEISYLIIILSGLNESQDIRFKSKKQIIF